MERELGQEEGSGAQPHLCHSLGAECCTMDFFFEPQGFFGFLLVLGLFLLKNGANNNVLCGGIVKTRDVRHRLWDDYASSP